MSRLVLVVMAAGMLCASCAAPPVATEFDDAATFARSFDDVWTAVMEVFADNMWAIDNLEKDSGLITTDWLSIGGDWSKYADCGKDFASTQSLTTDAVRFNVFVKQVGPDVVVRVNCLFTQASSIWWSGKVECLSKGYLEAKILAEVNEKLL